jgi:putative SOS response-associated peptidase YedK
MGFMAQANTRAGPLRVNVSVPFAFLTTELNREVGAIHPKAMPVILTTRKEIELWMSAPAADALKLQHPLADDAKNEKDLRGCDKFNR